MRSLFSLLPLSVLPFLAIGQSIEDNDGYTGYKLNVRQDGDPLAVLYETENTKTSNVSATVPEPDVLLNASVHVGEISVDVQNLTAKINLDAQVLQLLQFNAGVDASIDRVRLLIQNVTAKVYLEARLANLVTMVGDILDSIDLNPVIAELGSGLGTIINETGELIGGLTGEESTNEKRSIDLFAFELANNILYSVNDFSGNTHTNRVLAQNGDIVEQQLDNNGRVSGTKVVGNYLKDMRFNGFNQTVHYKGEEVIEEEYVYEPFLGLMAISGVFKSKTTGEVVGTQLLAEARGGGSATIGSSEELRT